VKKQEIPEWMREFKSRFPRWAEVKITERGTEIVNGCHMPSLKVKSHTSGSADVYSFRFEEPFSWAIFTINNATGEFHIQSDWGNWQHRWPMQAIGESHAKHEKPLTHFLGDRGDAGYVTDKLHYDCNDKRDQFSEDRTKEEIKKQILSARIYGASCRSEEDDRPWYMYETTKKVLQKWIGIEIDENWYSDGITKEEARTLWDQLENIDWSSADSFMQSLEYNTWGELDELRKFLSEPWYEYIQTEATFGWNLLCYKLLPFFFEYLRREVLCIEEKVA
jgi:hypothetical protein